MRTSILASAFLILIASVIALYAQESSNLVPSSSVEGESSETTLPFPDGTTYQEIVDKIPVPQETSFDTDEKKRQQYTNSYREGYIWAAGHHFLCPTNPNDTNHHAIHGWIDGWKAGAENGGTGGLPAKYAPFIAWDAIKKTQHGAPEP